MTDFISDYNGAQVDAAIAARPLRARQAILYGKIDSDGQADFLSYSGKTVTLEADSTNFVGTWASGFDLTNLREVNYIGKVTANVTWEDADLTDGTADGDITSILYLDYNTATGGITKGATNVRPEYGYARVGIMDLAIHTDYDSATGTAAASSEYSASFRAWEALNEKTAAADSWITTNGVYTGWFHYARKFAAVPKEYMLTAYNTSNHANTFPMDWTYEGSNLASPTPGTPGDWDVLDTQASQASPGQGLTAHYSLSGTTAYKHTLLRVTDTNGTRIYLALNRFQTRVTQDFYSIPTGEILDVNGAKIHRLPIGEADIDSSGNVTAVRCYAIGNQVDFWANSASELAVNTLYTEANPFGHSKVDITVFWNQFKRDESKRRIIFSDWQNAGPTMRITEKNILIGTGATYTCSTQTTGDSYEPLVSTKGFYLCSVKRTF